MKLKTTICVTDPDYYNSILYDTVIETDKNTFDNEFLITEFFRNWDKKDKYTRVYSLGVLNVEIL